MQSLLLILAALPLIAVVIWLLHKYQLRKSAETAELANPLPPLDSVAESSPQARVGVAEAIGEHLDSPLAWQDEVARLRDNGQFQEALNLCRRQYPRMLALQQTLDTLRARIRLEDDPGEETLKSLYSTAVLGSWLHAAGNESATQISRQLEQSGNPEVFWHSLGYKDLDLLTRPDRQLLIKHWGEPKAHASIEALPDLLPPAPGQTV